MVTMANELSSYDGDTKIIWVSHWKRRNLCYKGYVFFKVGKKSHMDIIG